MIIDNDFVTLLKNFASINPSIIFTPGNTLRTISGSRSVFAYGPITQSIPKQAALGDIAKFLNVISLFEHPEVEFHEKTLTVGDKGDPTKTSTFTYADPIYLTALPEKDVVLKKVEVSFQLSKAEITKIMKACSIFEQPDIAIEGDGNVITIRSTNSDSPVVDGFASIVGKTHRVFNLIFQRENLPLIPADYTVDLSTKNVQFKSTVVTYIATSKSSATQSYFKDE